MRQPGLIIPRAPAIVEADIEIQIKRADFQSQVRSFREKYKITELGEKTRNKFSYDIYDDLPPNWRIELGTLLRDLELHKQWFPVVLDYITTGQYSVNDDPEGIVVYEDVDDCPAFKETQYYLEIYPSTTKKDVSRAWAKVEDYMRKGKKIKPRVSKMAARDEYIFKLHEEDGESYKNIRTMVAEVYDDVLDDSRLRDIVSEQKKKIKSGRRLDRKK